MLNIWKEIISMKKSLKILLIVVLVITSLSLLSNYLESEAFGNLLVVLFFISLILFLSAMDRRKIEGQLIKSANYKKEKVSKMPHSELSNRLKLYKLDKETDYTSLSSEKVKTTLIQVKKSAGSSLQQFVDGFMQGSGKPKGSYGVRDVLNEMDDSYSKGLGTPGKRIVCINCGKRMNKTLGFWSTSIQCNNAGRKCVPYDTPKV